jgi:hypothetical protein
MGAAIAVSLGVGGVAITHAVVTSGERDVFVPISPCRLFDIRPAPDQVGPRGTPLQPGETYTQAVRGANGNCNIPADATAVAMNVTAVGGTAGSFLTIWPSDVAPKPLASNLNWVPGSPPTPNKVDVKVSVADGKINLFNLTGTVSVLADVVGYYADHNFDDRYYTKTQTDALAAQADAKQSRIASSTNNGVPLLNDGATITTVALTVAGSTQLVHIEGEATLFTNNTQAGACISVGFCNIGIEIFDADTNTRLTPSNGAFFRLTTASDGGTLYLSVVVSAPVGTHTYRLQTEFNQVNVNQIYLAHGTLTATTAPLNGAGVAPAGSVDAEPSSGPNPNAATGG